MNDDPDLEAMLAEVRSQAPLRALSRLDHEACRRLGMAACRIAESERLPVSFAVFRGEQRVFSAAFVGTTAEHDGWIRRKRATALLHDIPSLEFVLRQRVAGRVPDWLDPLRFAVAGGAVPLVVDGGTAGVAVATGLVGSIRDDHDFVMRAIAAAQED
jgi:uncharacterized protein (UPF0303 family)